MKQRPDSRKSGFFGRGVTVAARAFLAVTLLLTLVAGSIAWPAAASGPLCALACCAGKAPHAAGSCMHGACDAGDSIHFVTTSDRQHAHHHDDQQAQTLDSDNNAPQILAGVTAGVCGTEMELVPTIEAAPDQPVADDSALAVTPEPENPYSAVSATTISQPCQSDCGACTSGFATNRSRNTASLTVFKSVPSPLSILRARVTQSQAYAASVYSRQSPPRGPPSSSSL